MTAVEQYVMTEVEAHKVTEDIRHNAKSFTEYRARLMEAVDRAKAGSAHIALGYKSWTAYLSDVLGEEPMRLARAESKDFALMLADQGMGSRAIAPIVGRSDRQVRRDIAGGTNVPREPAPEFVDTRTGEIHEGRVSNETPTAVTGMDGKQYSRPAPAEPPKPRRRPLTDAFFDAAYDLQKDVERIQRLVEDDRFPQNKEQIALKHKNDLLQTADALAGALRHINN